MTNKELFYFTGKCMMLDEDPGFSRIIVDKINSETIDWQIFVTMCSDHLILPVIYLKFEKHNILASLPNELTEFLKEIYDLNASRNRQILSQIQEVTKTLNANNIYPIYLKGAAHLLSELYSAIGERILGDIDFLVPEKDYLTAAKVLENDGYSTFEDIPKYFDVEQFKHYPRISKPGFPADLEIHQALTQNPLSWFDPQITDQEKKPVKSLEGCFVLSDNHQIIHNFIHSQLSHGGHSSGIVSFRDLYDLYLLSKRMPFNDVLPNIKTKQKAIAYFLFAGKAFGLSKPLNPKGNLSSWLFSKKHDLNMGSATFYNTHRTLLFIFQRIFTAYLGQIIKSFYSKSVRQSVISRFKDRKWYRAHFQIYIDFFRRKR
ncbi:MAG: nucleotidyltransferase family protein [Mariniphaga sp.]